jgi:Tfp pilus assembly protein PilF
MTARLTNADTHRPVELADDPADETAPDGRSWRRVSLIVLLVAAALTANLPALPGAFVWDDEVAIAKNPLVTGAASLPYIWFSADQPDYWPVSYSTLWLEWRIWGAFPPAYRLVNMLCHALNVVLLYWLLSRLDVAAAWLAALIFAIHPVTIEAIDWIIQCKTLLATGFSLATVLLVLDAHQHGRRASYWAGLATFVLAMLSKTSAVSTPVVLLALFWWRNRSLARRDVLFTLPWFAIALALGAAGVWFQKFHAIAGEVVRDDGFLSRLLIAARAVWFYLSKALFPVRLSFVYPRWQLDVTAVSSYLPLIALLALFAFLVFYRHRWPAPLAAAGSYVALLFPALGFSNIYFMKYSLVADHWQYQALPAVIALLVGGIAWLLAAAPAFEKPAIGLAAVCCGTLFIASFSRAAIFGGGDNERLWRDTLAKNRSSHLAYSKLATLLAARGDWTQASGNFEKAVELDPADIQSRLDLGRTSYLSGKPAVAEVQFREVLRRQPKSVAALSNLALTLSAQGRTADAEATYRQALAIEPRNPGLLSALGALLCQLGRTDEGTALLEQAVALEPRSVSARYNLGLVHMRRRELPQAADQFRAALESNPRSINALLMLGETLRMLQQTNESAQVYRQVLALNPDLWTAHYGLARTLADDGQFLQAAYHLRRCLKARPDFYAARQLLNQIQPRSAPEG